MSATMTASGGSARAVIGRGYDSTGNVSVTGIHEVQMDFRVDSSLSTFTNVNDKVNIFGAEKTQFAPLTNDTILATAQGAASGTIAAKHWIVANGSTNVDTGITLAQGTVYHFTFVIDTANEQYTAYISDGTAGTGHTYQSGTMAWGNSNSFGPGDPMYVNIGGRVDGTSESLSFSFDNVKVTPPPPVAPTALTISTISSNELDLSWTDNSSTETGFVIERSTDNSTWTPVTTTSANTTTYSDNTLSSGTTYYYRVRATNEGGDSGNVTATGITPGGYPTAPTGLTATASSTLTDTINLAWTDNSSNESGFIIDRSTDNSSWTNVTTTAANATSYSDTGLSGGTLYYYRVRATNTTGDSSNATANATTGSLADPASGLNLTAVSQTEIDLTWTDNSTNETGFKIERSTDGTIWTTLTTTSANATTYSDTSGLSADTLYYYDVIATNSYGDSSEASNGTTTLPNAPDAPTAISTTTVSPTEVDLTWTDNADNETGYTIERKTGSSGTWSQIAVVGTDESSYWDTTTSEGTQYYYRVAATNTGGGSSYDTTSSVTTPLAAPSDLIVNNVSSTENDLTWADNSSLESGYTIERSTDGTTWSTVTTTAANATGFEDSELPSGTSYMYRITGFDALTSSAITPFDSGGPAQPTLNVSNDGSDPQNELDVAYSTSDGSHLELEMQGPDDDNYHVIADLGTPTDSSTQTTEVGGLLEDTTYAFRLRADQNGLVTYAYCSATTAATDNSSDDPDATLPPPTNLSVTLDGNHHATIAFEGSHGDPGVSDYRIDVVSTRIDDPYHILDLAESSFPGNYSETSTGHYTTGAWLPALGASYVIQLAVTDTSTSEFGVSDPITVSAGGTVLAPVTLTSSAAGSGYVTLSWSGDNSSDDAIRFFGVKDDDIDWTPSAVLASDGSDTLLGPPTGSKIVAVDQTISSSWGEEGFKESSYSNFVDGGGSDSTPADPSNLTATLGDGKDKVRLLWDNDSNNEDQFVIYEKLHDDPDTAWLQVETTSTDVTNYEITLADPSKVYDFEVKAKKGATTSGPSNVVEQSGILIRSVDWEGFSPGNPGFSPEITIDRDNGNGSYGGDDWLDGNLNGQIDGTAFSENQTVDGTTEHRYPVAFVRSTTGKAVYLAGDLDLAFDGQIGANWELQGDSDGYQFTAMPVDGQFVELIASSPLPSTIDSEQLQVHWQLSTGGEFFDLGTTMNHLYVTGALTTDAYETVIHLGCEGGKGMQPSNPGGGQPLADAIFGEFSGRNVKRVDGTLLVYDPSQIGDYAGTPLSRTDGHGQCSSWADLLMQTFLAQGIDVSKELIEPAPPYDLFEVLPGPVQGGIFLAPPITDFTFHVIVKIGSNPDRIYDASFGVTTDKTNAVSVEQQWEDDHVDDFEFANNNGWLGFNPPGQQLSWSLWVLTP